MQRVGKRMWAIIGVGIDIVLLVGVVHVANDLGIVAWDA